MTKCLTNARISMAALVAVCAAAVSQAQTPAQMEYERQQREYRQQMERQREEQQRLQQLQMDNARRQQEESRRSMQALTPRSDSAPGRAGGTAAAGAGGTTPRAGAASAVDVCKKWPLRAGERNPLLGQWRPRDVPQGSGLDQLLQAAAAPGCLMYAMGIEFREREIRTVIAPTPALYGRVNEDWWICMPGTEVEVLRFRVQGPNQVFDPDRKCQLVRVGAASTPSARSAAPGVGAPVAVASSTGSAAALSFAASIASPGGAARPVAGRSFFLLRNSVDTVMANAGVQAAPGMSRLKTWALACESGSPACRAGANALIAASAAVTKTDANGRGRMQPLPAGAYYVFGVAPDASPALMWNIRVELKTGENTVTLDDRNSLPP